jgi:transcription antitermination factor NusG
MIVRRRWSDRWKDVELPLFPGYLFAEVSVDNWAALLRIAGVLTIVKAGRAPAWITHSQMSNLRDVTGRLAPAGQDHEVIDDFELGDRVRVIEGPMAGLVGVVREFRGSRRLLVGIEQIGKALSVSIGTANIERIGD